MGLGTCAFTEGSSNFHALQFVVPPVQAIQSPLVTSLNGPPEGSSTAVFY